MGLSYSRQELEETKKVEPISQFPFIDNLEPSSDLIYMLIHFPKKIPSLEEQSKIDSQLYPQLIIPKNPTLRQIGAAIDTYTANLNRAVPYFIKKNGNDKRKLAKLMKEIKVIVDWIALHLSLFWESPEVKELTLVQKFKSMSIAFQRSLLYLERAGTGKTFFDQLVCRYS